MLRAFALICLMTIALNSCARITPSSANTPDPAQPTSVQGITMERPVQGNCPVTEPIQDEPARDPNADPFGFGDWYVNADRSIWAPAQDWRVGGHKVIWIRPQGAQLEVTGRRLAGEAPPLHVDIPCCYPSGFQVTGLFFPAEGCWEVVGKAGESELRFVAEVAPAGDLVREEACASLDEAVKQSDAIVAGVVAESEIEGRYAWHEVEVTENWKPPGGMAGYGISVFQDLQAEPRLEKNSRYVLFLQPGYWKLLCPQRTVVKVQGEEAIPAGNDPLWPGGRLADLKAEIDRLLAVSPSSTAPATGIPPATPPKEPPPTLLPVTDYVVTGAAEGAPAGCSAQDIAQRLAEMLEAINRGDPEVVDEYFGRKNKAPFQWYSMTEFGKSEAENNHFVAYDFDELYSYLQERYNQNEKLQLRSIQVNSWEPGRGLVHFGPVLLTRHADDLRFGIGRPERLAEGKGAYHCETQAFVVLSLGMAWEVPIADTSARHEAFVLTGEQALEVAVFMNFIRAYNNGRLDEALGMLSEEIAISDCDYGVDATQDVKAVEFRGKSQAVEWLRQRISVQDQLIVSRIYNENPDPISGWHVIGVEYSRRSNTTLESLGFPEGIKPKLASKVVFEAGTALIQTFANGSIGGDPNFCRPER